MKKLPALLQRREAMLISDLLDLLPLFEHLWPEAFFTVLAQVFNLRPIAVAVFTVIVKNDVN